MNNAIITPIFAGFPARTSRGYLGWSSVHLIQIKQKETMKNYLFDTAGYNERGVLLEKLNELNVKPSDIHGVILSHLHFDHAINWTLFPDAQICINEMELQASEKDLAVPDFHQKELKKSGRINFVAEGDEIDGMKIIEVPGHTPGMIALDAGGRIFASDAIKNRMELIHGPLGNTWDAEQAEASIKKLMKLADTIYPGHDVPLIFRNGKWETAFEAEETIFLVKDLKDFRNENVINLSISCCSDTY